MPPIYKNVCSKDDSILCSGVSVEWVGDNGEISVEYYATCSPYWCRLHSCRYLFSGFWCFPSAWSCKLCTYYLKDSVPVEPRESLNGYSRHFRPTSLSSVDPSVRPSVSHILAGWLGWRACPSCCSSCTTIWRQSHGLCTYCHQRIHIHMWMLVSHVIVRLVPPVIAKAVALHLLIVSSVITNKQATTTQNVYYCSWVSGWGGWWSMRGWLRWRRQLFIHCRC